MKKVIMLLAGGLFFWGSAVSYAQRISPFSTDQQAKLERLKREYVTKGWSEISAYERAISIIEAENRVTTRSRLATPSANSIWVDRDPANFTNYHPVYHTYTPEQFVKKVLLNNPAAESAITNVQFIGHNWNGAAWTGDDRSLHYFENGHKLGINHGLILATGPVLSAEGPNNASSQLGGGTTVTGDSDLATICSDVRSGSILEFDFVPYTDKATFDFIFVSEEYGDYSNKHNVNDAFGFFVSKVGSSNPPVNIAKFPNDSAVTISNSNWGYRGDESSAYYTTHPADTTGLSAAGWPVPNASPIAVNPQWHIPNPTDGGEYMEYDGQTIKLQAVANNLRRGEKYHLKLAICNKGDDAFGSAIFLANLDLGIPDVGISQPYLGAWDSKWDKYGENHLYSDCNQTMTLKFKPDTMDREITLTYLGVASKETVVQTNGKVFPDTLKLAAGDSMITLPFKTLTVPIEANGKEGAIVACVVGGGCDTMKNKKTGQLFKFHSGISTSIKYIRPTVHYAGQLKLNIFGGSNYVFRSIDKGLHWELARDSVSGEERPFTDAQIDLFENSDKVIWLREPNACSQPQFYHFTKDTIPGVAAPRIFRLILMPDVAGATLSAPVGMHYVSSDNNFSFDITPTGANAGKVPVVETGRKDMPKGRDVEIKDNGNGSFTVTIYKVQANLELKIFFMDSNSNTVIGQEAVWSNNGILYISASAAGKAQVYNVNGAAIRTITFSAGQTAFPLPQGVYVVTLDNGNTYKVVVK